MNKRNKKNKTNQTNEIDWTDRIEQIDRTDEVDLLDQLILSFMLSIEMNNPNEMDQKGQPAKISQIY